MVRDEGIFYITFLPEESNPVLRGIENTLRSRPIGVVPQENFALIPVIIKFTSLNKKMDQTRCDLFHREMQLKINESINKAIDKFSESIRQAEKWTDVVTDASLRTFQQNVFIKFEYGEVTRGMLEILVSDLVSEIPRFAKKHEYQVDVTRTDMDIMLLARCAYEDAMNRFLQRINDENIKISARRWKMGVSLRKKFIWERSWWDVIKRITLILPTI